MEAERDMARDRVIRVAFYGGLAISALVLLVLTFSPVDFHLTAGGTTALMLLAALAFGAEYVDSSIGMGYGTTLTPLLLILGFTPLQVVPAILLSEFVSGVTAGLLHQSAGNVDFRPGTRAHRTMRTLLACSLIGTVVAVTLALRLPGVLVKLYIGIMILGIGVYILVHGRRGASSHFSGRRIVFLGTLAAFNKGISGGGYGPLLTGGQVIAGIPEKEAISITSLAEGLVCLVGFGLYLALNGAPDWGLAVPICTGAILSVPMATWTVRILPASDLRWAIGYATLFLGLLTLIKLL
jgi:uncharacterized membrane protein YfcA